MIPAEKPSKLIPNYQISRSVSFSFAFDKQSRVFQISRNCPRNDARVSSFDRLRKKSLITDSILATNYFWGIREDSQIRMSKELIIPQRLRVISSTTPKPKPSRILKRSSKGRKSKPTSRSNSGKPRKNFLAKRLRSGTNSNATKPVKMRWA